MTTSMRLLFDIGSSSVRCAALVAASPSAPHSPVQVARMPLHAHADGTFQVDEVMNVCDAACSAVLAAPHVLAATRTCAVIDVAFSTFIMNALLLDSTTLTPVSHVFTYAARSASTHATTARLRQQVQVHDPAYHDRTGAPVHAAYLPSQWPQHARGILTTLASLCIARWAGVPVHTVGISLSECAWMGVCDLRAMALQSTLLPHDGLVQLPTVFSRVAPVEAGDIPASSPLAPLAERASRLRLWRGLGDGAAASFGCAGAGQHGPITCTIGTSAAVRAFMPRAAYLDRTCAAVDAACLAAPRPHDTDVCTCPACGKVRLSWTGLWAYCIDDTRVLVGGALTDGGSLISTLSTQFKQDCTQLDKTYVNLATACGAAAGGDAASAASHAPCSLLCMPFLSGERATGWHDAATGAFIGVTHATTAQDYAAAAMEGVAFRLRAMLHRLHALLGDTTPRPVVLNGGALDHAPAWVAILANVFGAPLEWMSSSSVSSSSTSGMEVAGVETTTLGLSVMIDAALGVAEHPSSRGRMIIPVAEVSDRYSVAYVQHRRVYDALAPLWD